MLRLLERLVPSVRLARELACTQERLAAAQDRISALTAEHLVLTADRDGYRRRYDTLVAQRLYKQGDTTTPDLVEPIAKKPAALAPPPFANLARLHPLPPMEPPQPSPVGDAVAG